MVYQLALEDVQTTLWKLQGNMVGLQTMLPEIIFQEETFL